MSLIEHTRVSLNHTLGISKVREILRRQKEVPFREVSKVLPKVADVEVRQAAISVT